MTEPTDAELLEVIREAARGGAIRRDGSTSLRIARAVLAKWGTPTPKTNQCGEVCERAKLCAICARGLDGTPAPVGVEPVGEVGSMPGTDGFTMACFKASDVPIGTKLYTAEVLAMGRVPLTDEMASKAGRALSDLYATECGVDKEDNWKVYGSDFIATAKLVLEAVGIKGGQHGTE